MTSRYFASPLPRLFAHRGFSARYPENTLPAFSAAWEAGIPYLELDVWASRDGRVMVHHDETLYRMCGKWRRIRNLTLAEITSCDAGWGFRNREGKYPFRGQGITVPTLEEVFAACPDAFVNIEIKQRNPPIEELVVAAVRCAGREETVLLASEHDEVMARLRPLAGAIPTGSCRGDVVRFFDWLKRGRQPGYQPQARVLQVPESYYGTPIVFPESIAAAHALGIEIHVWTVNKRPDVIRLLQMGVDGIMSDEAEMLVETAREPGQPKAH